MSYFEPKGTSLNIATNTQELRKLIIENPDLPLLVFAGPDAYLDDGVHSKMACSSCVAELAEYLDCYVEEDGDFTIFTDRDELSDIIEDYCEDTDDPYDSERFHSYDPYWKKCIILYVDN